MSGAVGVRATGSANSIVTPSSSLAAKGSHTPRTVLESMAEVRSARPPTSSDLFPLLHQLRLLHPLLLVQYTRVPTFGSTF